MGLASVSPRGVGAELKELRDALESWQKVAEALQLRVLALEEENRRLRARTG